MTTATEKRVGGEETEGEEMSTTIITVTRPATLSEHISILLARHFETLSPAERKELETTSKRLDALETELAGWKLFADELVSFDPNNEDEIKDAATNIAARFHEMKAENERLRSRIDGYQSSRDYAIDVLAGALQIEADKVRAVEYYAAQTKELIERLRAELATARNDALALTNAVDELLEVAALRGDDELPHPSNDPILWTARMQEAWDNLKQLRALKREGGSNG